MTIRAWMTMGGLMGVLTTSGWGLAPTITSFQGNGRVAWTNTANTNAVYRMEWAAQAAGPWYQTLQGVHTLDAHAATAFAAPAPMFYRIVMVTNEPPLGMAWIDGGDVELGQAGITEPVRTNFVSGFWMDAMLVTKAKWDDVAGWAATNSYDIAPSNAAGKAASHPVHSVNWFECVKWCNARSQKEGLVPCYYADANFASLYKAGSLDLSNSWVRWSANGYRLPTEAEWEKAARGGHQGRLFPWGGDTCQQTRANYYADDSVPYDTSPTLGYNPAFNDGVQPYTSPVGSFPANGYGLYDMAGNVGEWCWDWRAAPTAGYQSDPRGPASGYRRVVRGGAWNSSSGAYAMRCAYAHDSDFMLPSDKLIVQGFRCARGQ